MYKDIETVEGIRDTISHLLTKIIGSNSDMYRSAGESSRAIIRIVRDELEKHETTLSLLKSLEPVLTPLSVPTGSPIERDFETAAKFYAARSFGRSKDEEVQRLKTAYENAILDPLGYLFMQYREHYSQEGTHYDESNTEDSS